MAGLWWCARHGTLSKKLKGIFGPKIAEETKETKGASKIVKDELAVVHESKPELQQLSARQDFNYQYAAKNGTPYNYMMEGKEGYNYQLELETSNYRYSEYLDHSRPFSSGDLCGAITTKNPNSYDNWSSGRNVSVNPQTIFTLIDERGEIPVKNMYTLHAAKSLVKIMEHLKPVIEDLIAKGRWADKRWF